MVYVIMGPTCSGKTELANYLIDKLNCDAINFDAFQIYKDMNIGTSKISKNDPAYSKHYLLDFVSPEETFSVMEYQKIARKTLDELLTKNENVIIVGGTGLYIKALLYDYQFLEEEPQDNSDLEELDNESLHKMLSDLDIEEAKKIHVNNRKRLIRAISLIRNNNVKKSELVSKQTHKIIYPLDQLKIIFLSPDRNLLYEKINERVNYMIKDGLVEEVKYLLNTYNLSLTARQAIGYKEIISYLNNEMSLDDAIALIQKRTRNYAKRQVTFFKNQFDYLETVSSFEELMAKI